MATKKRPGRPSSYKPEFADAICERIAAGESLRAICAEDGMPNASTVIRWLAAGDDDIAAGVESEFTGFCKQYARAREQQADADADRISQLAAETLEGRHDPAAARVALDALKWSAGRRNPKKYGDRQVVEQSVSGEIAHTVRVVLSDE